MGTLVSVPFVPLCPVPFVRASFKPRKCRECVLGVDFLSGVSTYLNLVLSNLKNAATLFTSNVALRCEVEPAPCGRNSADYVFFLALWAIRTCNSYVVETRSIVHEFLLR
jgi:hypothetical protein